ncbi:MAG TPA: VOC family protein [Haliangiales bacterium]|nr:VOC family protein [Haliangiales bacterium]
MIERYSFVAITTTDLARARRFWADQMGFGVTEESPGHHFIVDAGGLRLCVDLADGDVHRAGGGDPVIGFKVEDVARTLDALARRGVRAENGPIRGQRGAYAELRDPDGRVVVLTERD